MSATKTNAKFPKAELDKWIKDRISWNHSDWIELLDSLREKGYKHLTDTDAGQGEVGQYLEEKRKANLQLPKTELSQWLKTHRSWSNDEWLKLLQDLRKKGFQQLVDSQFGRDMLGKFLEENRQKTTPKETTTTTTTAKRRTQPSATR